MKEKFKKIINIIRKKFIKIIENNNFQKTLIIVIGWCGVFFPVYISLFFWWILNPVGFVERLLFIILCLVTLGWIQVILIFVGLAFTLKVLDEWY